MNSREALLFWCLWLTFDTVFIWTYIRCIRDGIIYFQQGKGVRSRERKFKYWLWYHGSGILIFLILQLFALYHYFTGRLPGV